MFRKYIFNKNTAKNINKFLSTFPEKKIQENRSQILGNNYIKENAKVYVHYSFIYVHDTHNSFLIIIILVIINQFTFFNDFFIKLLYYVLIN